MQIKLLTKTELAQLSKIDQDVNLTPWSPANFSDAYANLNQQIWGIYTPAAELIGGCVLSQVLDEAEILQLSIAKAWQGQGYAAKLFRYIIHELSLRKVTAIFLEVRKDNLAAIHLYQACGFNQIALRKNYYHLPSGRMDALIMAKHL